MSEQNYQYRVRWRAHPDTDQDGESRFLYVKMERRETAERFAEKLAAAVPPTEIRIFSRTVGEWEPVVRRVRDPEWDARDKRMRERCDRMEALDAKQREFLGEPGPVDACIEAAE